MKEFILITKGGKKFTSVDISKDFHSQFGLIKKEQFKGASPGTVLKTNMDKELYLLEKDFLDKFSKIKRGAQIITRKDAGYILANTGIGRDSVVIDAGAGSGALSIFLARYVKRVHSYELREDHLKIVKTNIDKLEIKNIKLNQGDVCKDVKEKNADLLTLDIPEPWTAMETLSKSLKVGGYCVSYSPCITQSMQFVEAIKKEGKYVILETIEISKRDWDVLGKKVRPSAQQSLGHTAFLTFVRKITN